MVGMCRIPSEVAMAMAGMELMMMAELVPFPLKAKNRQGDGHPWGGGQRLQSKKQGLEATLDHEAHANEQADEQADGGRDGNPDAHSLEGGLEAGPEIVIRR